MSLRPLLRSGQRALAFLAGAWLVLISPPLAAEVPVAAEPDMHFRLKTESQPTIGPETNSTADHSKFKVLQGPFGSGPEVTRACLSCHTEAGKQFMHSTHWKWEYKNPKTGQILGKKTLINNFCTNAKGNEGMCAQCHAGYGWKDASFDFSDQNNIDCVVCHDRTGTYYKTPNSGGNKACSVMFKDRKPIDWARVAQNVGLPGREDCGSCHFYGGGGDGVKHGDLDSSLAHPPKSLDVHMDAKGLNFACTQCHITKQHQVAGSRYDVMAKDTGGTGKPGMRRDVATCESCHGSTPHPANSVTGIKLNDHTDRVACQTCHIPAMARGGVATMKTWDWRTAGRTRNGEGYKEHGYVQGNGKERDTYKSIKGSFVYGENLTPHYAWFDGQMQYTTIDTRFDPARQPIAINGFTGRADDPKSRIWPFKRMHTVQPYDKGNNTLVYTHLWGDDENAYWGNYDMGRAIAAGMAENGKPYSGQFGFIETYSFWPITHMVAPKEAALACQECHAKQGRLAEIKGIYLPGRDANHWVDLFGMLGVGSALLGVFLHAGLRLFTGKREQH